MCHNHPRYLYIRKYFAIWRFYMNIQLTVNSRSARVKNNRGNFTLGLSPCLTALAKLVSLSVSCFRWGDSLSPMDVGSCPSLALSSSSSWFPLSIDWVVCSRRIPLVSCCSPFAVPMYEQIAFSNLHLYTLSMCVLLRWILRRIIKRWFPGSIILKVYLERLMLLCNCSSTSVLMTAFSSGTSVTRRSISGALDEFFSWKRSQREYLSVTPVTGWTSSCDFSSPKENWNAFGMLEPCTQGKWITKRPSFAASMFSSVGWNSLPSFGLKKWGTVLFACVAMRCGISEMLMDGGNARDRNMST